MLYVSTFNNDNLNPNATYFDSSESRLNNMLGQINGNNINSDIIFQDESATITKYTYDDDNDGINDRLIIRYETNNNNEIISNKKDFKLLFFLKYRLTKQVKLLMTPMVYIDSTTITSQIYNKEKPLNVDENLYSPFDMLNLYNEYKELNYTLKYNYEKVEKSAQGKLIINIEMNIPKLQRVFYIQSVFEAIKYAWMQYFYIFLPIYIILYSIYKFIIESNIFYSHVKSDL